MTQLAINNGSLLSFFLGQFTKFLLKEIRMDWSIIVIIVQLIFLEMILSIDNAAVMGAMVSHLSDHEADHMA